MPTQDSYEGLPSEGEEKTVNPSGTSEQGQQAPGSKNSRDTDVPMTKAEALAIAWTGIEVLAKLGQARLYRMQRNGLIVIELLATEYTVVDGLKPLARKEP